MLWRKKKILGLDIGKRAIKAALLRQGGGNAVLEKFVYFDLRGTAHPAIEPEDVQRVLSALMEGSGLQNIPTAGSIQDIEVRLLNFQLPKLPDAELAQILANEAESKTGEPADTLAVDYLPRANGENLELRTFITRKDSVFRQLQLMEAANLRPVSLESSVQATIESLRFNGYLDQPAAVVADIGESHITIGLVLNQELVLMNSGKFGTGTINEKLMEKFGCTYDEAEERKIAYELEQGEVPSIDPAAKLIEEGYLQLIVHLHDTINYFKASYREQNISSLILTGGGAQKAGFDHAIAQTTGLEVIKADLLRRVEFYSSGDPAQDRLLPCIAPLLHTAIGLALRGAA